MGGLKNECGEPFVCWIFNSISNVCNINSVVYKTSYKEV